jgi:hypothetical protein
MAFSGRPCGPPRIRVAQRARGATAGGRAPSSRLAPALRHPGTGPGPGRAPRPASRPLAAAGPDSLYAPAAGPSRAGIGPLSHVTDASCGARAAPVGPTRRARHGGIRGVMWGDVTCVLRPGRLSWPSVRGGLWGGRASAPARTAVWQAQRKIGNQLSAPGLNRCRRMKSPVPGEPCHELR